MSNILLVDDDNEFLEATSYMLGYNGHEVMGAVNGEDAIKKYKDNRPDIVLMDIKMPVLDGYEAFYKIKKIDHNAKIIFTSSYTLDDEKFQKAKNSTLSGLINKPFDIEAVQKLIDKYT